MSEGGLSLLKKLSFGSGFGSSGAFGAAEMLLGNAGGCSGCWGQARGSVVWQQQGCVAAAGTHGCLHTLAGVFFGLSYH